MRRSVKIVPRNSEELIFKRSICSYMRIFCTPIFRLQKSASTQPRTDLPKLGLPTYPSQPRSRPRLLGGHGLPRNERALPPSRGPQLGYAARSLAVPITT